MTKSAWGSSYYEKMNGTSMACPVVAGACALYMSVYGPTDPDDMEKILKKSATKCASAGTGAGIVNVARMLNAVTETPTITLKDGSGKTLAAADAYNASAAATETADAAAMITIETASGDLATNGIIVYTTNGKAPAAKNGAITSGTRYTGAIAVSSLEGTTGAKKFTIKAACAGDTGVLGPVSTLKFSFLPTTITVTGPGAIAKGASATFRASGQVVWKLQGADGSDAESIDNGEKNGKIAVGRTSGKVSVGKNASPGTYTIYALGSEEGGEEVRKSATFTVVEKETGIRITANSANSIYQIRKKKDDALTSLRLFAVNAVSATLDETSIRVTAGLNNSAAPVWTSSNPKVATVTAVTRTIALVRGIGRGSAKITCTAGDGSGKKATFKVTVAVPISNVMLTNPGLDSWTNTAGTYASWVPLAYGKSTQTKVTAGDAYGKPTSAKVTWSYHIGVYKYGENSGDLSFVNLTEESQSRVLQKKIFTVKNGKVKIHKNYYTLSKNMVTDGYDGFAVRVRATAADGSGVYAEKIIVPSAAVSRLSWNYLRSLSSGWAKLTANADAISLQAKYPIYVRYGSGTCYAQLAVKSSNPAVANGYYERESGGSYIYVSTGKRGKATLTVTATDGSNKKVKLLIIVN